jgi:transcriptional regulator with XRE-family HTH domain
MPTPGPLGRLVRRRRGELGLTQFELSDLTEKYGARVSQNNISRLESGQTKRMNDIDKLASLGKALSYESHEEFILAAYGPSTMGERTPRVDPTIEVLPAGPEGDMIMIVRKWPEHRKRRAVEMLRLMDEMDEAES